MSRDIIKIDTPQWRSARERDLAPEDLAAAEFPTAWAAADTAQARRDFLKVMGASMGLAGLGACVKQPEEKIVPYVKQPEQLIPGRPRFYATTFTRGGYGQGVVAESPLGRPTHLEGNTQHPASLGGMDPVAQASVLELWDPDRSKAVVRRGKVGSWGLFAEEVFPALSKVDSSGGRGFHILTGNLSSPSLVAQIRAVQKVHPFAVWHQWEPVHRDAVRRGTEIAFGAPKEVRYDFKGARVVLALDADFLTEAPGRLVYARQLFGRVGGEAGPRNHRLYAVESAPTSTGVVADHRWRARGSEMGGFLLDVAQALGVAGASSGGSRLSEKAKLVAEDLGSAQGHAVVVVGDHLPAEVHALAHAVNAHLGAIGKTVLITKPVHEESVDNLSDIESLTKSMNAGEVEVLLVLDGNPVYDAPGEFAFKDAFEKVPLRIHAGLYENETARLSQWHLPMSHYLETWSDARAFDGTLSIGQPLIAPLYDTRSSHEILGIFADNASAKAADVVKEYWEEGFGEDDEAWMRALHDGVVSGTAFAPEKVRVSAAAAQVDVAPVFEGLEVVIKPCPNVLDGRHANNAWLQETPRPVTRVVWDNAVYMSPATAKRLKLGDDEVVRVSADGRTVEGAAWVVPGAADDVLTLHLGYGRTAGGKVLEGAGFSAYPLTGSQGVVASVSLEPVRRSYRVVSVQDHWSLEGRNHVRHATKAEYRADPAFAQAPKKHVLPLNLYPEIKYEGQAWGMVLDLTSCTGCNACMVACQSENNVPVVGKEQVGKGREMHWIRIDRYYEGEAEEPQLHMQPLTCMHCERAPCEPVCPANATVHGPEGINQMVYNRCIGTRYCSNNCPYKVRRFNFHLYADFDTESLKGQLFEQYRVPMQRL
ncbi:MAG: 4Fe-4S dicluster domain-containing protein [Myxococcota bacterium]